ncbi:MAG: hypothetical protein MI923_00095 [Phycisphaerales bacterium]|nr:hypothetical protein [Phycisphaerales bacterium]
MNPTLPALPMTFPTLGSEAKDGATVLWRVLGCGLVGFAVVTVLLMTRRSRPPHIRNDILRYSSDFR